MRKYKQILRNSQTLSIYSPPAPKVFMLDLFLQCDGLMVQEFGTFEREEELGRAMRVGSSRMGESPHQGRAQGCGRSSYLHPSFPTESSHTAFDLRLLGTEKYKFITGTKLVSSYVGFLNLLCKLAHKTSNVSNIKMSLLHRLSKQFFWVPSECPATHYLHPACIHSPLLAFLSTRSCTSLLPQFS